MECYLTAFALGRESKHRAICTRFFGDRAKALRFFMASRAPVFRVQPGDAPADIAARRLGLTMERFVEVLPRLLARGFPPADPDTGNFDLEAIDVWRRSRHMHLTGAGEMTARDAGQVARDRIAALRKGAA